MLDIIIPVYNEEEILRDREDYYVQLGRLGRVIFVDGGSQDETRDVAGRYGTVLSSKRGRSIQMNEAVKHSKADHLLFLHVDTFVLPESIAAMRAVLSNGGVGGCFRMKIEEKGVMYRIFEKIINFRARVFGIIDGDLGLFVKRSVFDEIGQYDPLPIMEDILLSRKMRKQGKVHVVGQPIKVSGRKWRREGFPKTFLKYTLAYVQLWTGLKIFSFSHESSQP